MSSDVRDLASYIKAVDEVIREVLDAPADCFGFKAENTYRRAFARGESAYSLGRKIGEQLLRRGWCA